MRSLRSRLLALWIMLVVSGVATGYLLFDSFRQTSNARVARSEELVARACREVADRYQFFVSGWGGGPIEDRLKRDLVSVEADVETHAEERRRFAIINIPRYLFSEATAAAARRAATKKRRNR